MSPGLDGRSIDANGGGARLVEGNASLDPADAFETVRHAWERERARAPRALFEASYGLAHETIRLRVVGPKLQRLVSRPFAHLQSSGLRPATLTIDLYEAAAEVRGRRPSGVVASSADGRLLAYERADSLTVLDRRQGHLVGWMDPDGAQAGRERARPLSLMLAVWLSDRDVQLVHAGLVGRDGHGVLLGGSSGAGKSTATLACASAGFDFLSDDCVALRLDRDGTFEGHSLYCSAALAPEQLMRFPALAAHGTELPPGDDGKAIIFGTEAFPGRLPSTARLRLLVLPRIVEHGRLGARPASAAEALLALGPSSLVRRAVPAHSVLRQLARLVERVPSYWLDVDPRLDAIPREVSALLAAMTRRDGPPPERPQAGVNVPANRGVTSEGA